MINWIPFNSVEQIHEIQERSKEVPCLIFKHSTSCSISALAKHRLENYWDLDDTQVEVYFLDLLRHRPISNQIAEDYGVWHESPQILLIRDGKCVYHSSHLDITVHNIKEHLEVPMDS
ncbi:bacillithiol system redox-active protein YtxJ [Flavilitoribacter nigricans]|uniref:Bacillithiol system redox-active protein YtxJ n=1 Tax=Flavilitoribacter nigricans (strain ATCC 23147 / DSM 23189 / NBRC 102662 / NCIMB 1420 / SS-2) TaxID=1122177 RepID=A0A2D0NJ72_FLAN2|nr:bacillithiol system redox-active protein YtxJ [Flavilitoribacter nigricans]PHN08440.1 bacillithiol system redox-active protein YtxJ [Flavilitoribacter nigricans DSM 23189 = NBRC 102662]